MKIFVFAALLAILGTSVDGALRHNIPDNNALEWVKSDSTGTAGRELESESSETFEKGKLRIRSAGVCIGVPDLEGGVEDEERAIWVDCDLAPEFEMNDDYQLFFKAKEAPSSSSGKSRRKLEGEEGQDNNGGRELESSSSSDKKWCLHADSPGRVETRKCDDDKVEQVFYISAVFGRPEVWRFLNLATYQFLGIYLESTPSSSPDSKDTPQFWVPRLFVRFGPIDDKAGFQHFTNLNCPDFAFGPDISS